MAAKASMRRSSRSIYRSQALAELRVLACSWSSVRAFISASMALMSGTRPAERLDLLAFTGAEDAIEDAHAGSAMLPGSRRWEGPRAHCAG